MTTFEDFYARELYADSLITLCHANGILIPWTLREIEKIENCLKINNVDFESEVNINGESL